MDLERLKDPFEPDEYEWRIGQSGKKRDGGYWAKVLCYVTNRAIQDRLDAVCGPDRWQNTFQPAVNDPKHESVVCGIGIEVESGKWVWKYDAANNTDFEGVKGGHSDAMKRAAVQWGIGRLLYSLGESWATCETQKQNGDGWKWARTKDGEFWWRPPGLPADFLPSPSPQNSKAEKALAAVPGKLVRASALEKHERGDNFDWRQWTSPPAEVAASETPHPWYLQAVKGLLHHAGAGSVGNARKIFAWLSPGEVIDVKEAKENPIVAQIVWQLLCDRSNEVPFARMLHEANQHAETV